MNRGTIVALAVAAIAIVALVALVALRPSWIGDGEQPVVIEMTAERYAFTPGSETPLSVAQGSLVVLRVTSRDVTHGLSIVDLGVNEEIPAGETVEIRFRADRAGSFVIYCTVFCGGGHPDHKATLHVA